MANLKFDITGNANGFVNATRQAEAASGNMKRNVTRDGDALDSMFKKVAASAASLFSIQMASQFAKQVAQVRGQFQQLEVAFETMLQSKEKADALMAQVVDTAAKTPFDLQGVANGAKQLLAYGVASEEVNDTLIRLGDIAAGLSIPLNDLVYLYGTTMTQGRLFTQDLRQFQGRGIPLADELAKQFGVTKDAVGELVTAGKVGFPEVQKAIMNMTNEGGKFNNLMAKQSQTISGQISNLEDAIDQMFNNIGKASEGAISGAIGMASSLVENYEKVGKIIGGIVTTYGAYKAAIVALNAVDKARTAILAAQAVAQRANTLGVKNATTATVLFSNAQKALNKAMLSNPYVIAAAAVAALGVGIYALVTAKSKEERIHSRVNAELERYNENLEKQKQNMSELFDTINSPESTDSQKVIAMEQLRELYPSLLGNMSDEELLKLSLAEATKKLNEENERMLKSDLVEKIETASKKYDEAMKKINQYKSARPDAAIQTYKRDSGYVNATKDAENYRIELEALVTAFNKVDDAARKADFLSLPADKKIISLKANNEELDNEIAELDKKLKAIRDKKNLASVQSPQSFSIGSMSGAMYEGGLTEEQILAEIKAKQALKASNDRDIAENQAKVDQNNKELSEKQRKANYDRKKAEEKAAKDLEKMKRDLNNKVAQADIDSMEDGYAKTLKQLEHNLKLEKEAIQQQQEELLERKKNDALQNWLAEDPETRKAFDFVYTGGLTAEELKVFKDMGDLAQQQFDKGREEAGERWQKEAGFVQRQFEIDAMSAGKEKDKAQKDLDNEKELHALEMQRDAYIEAARAAHILGEERKAASDPAYKIQDFNKEAADAKFDQIIDATKLRQSADELSELKLKYEDFAQATKRIEQDLMYDLAKMRDENGNLIEGFSQENVDNAIRQAEELKNSLAVQYAEMDDSFQVYISSLADKTTGQLTTMLAKAEIELNTLEAIGDSDPDELARARAEVAKLKEQLKKLRIDKGTKEATVNWTDLNDVLSEASETFTELGSVIPGVSGQILSGIGAIASSAIGVANGIHAIGKAVSAAEKASAILAIVSAALKVVQMFTNLAEENRKANESSAKAALDYASAIDEVTYAERRASSENVFGKNSFAEFQENIKIASEQLDAITKKTSEGAGFDWIESKLNAGTSVWARFSKKFRDNMSEIGQLGSDALVSDMRTGWQKFWGSGNDNLQVVSLQDFINEDETLNVEELTAWYDAYGEGLSDKQKNIIEGLLKDWESYYDTLDQMTEYVSGLVDNTVDDIADRWITAFDETGSAITDLKDISNDFAKSFAKDMLKNMLSTEVFNKAAEDTLLAYIKAGDNVGAASYFDSLVQRAEALGEDATAIMQMAGVTSATETTRSAVSTGITQASQDSVDELNGRATAIQSHTFSINERVGNLVSITSQMLTAVRGVETNTSRLEQIEDSLSMMESNISDIVTKGIKVKA